MRKMSFEQVSKDFGVNELRETLSQFYRLESGWGSFNYYDDSIFIVNTEGHHADLFLQMDEFDEETDEIALGVKIGIHKAHPSGGSETLNVCSFDFRPEMSLSEIESLMMNTLQSYL